MHLNIVEETQACKIGSLHIQAYPSCSTRVLRALSFFTCALLRVCTPTGLSCSQRHRWWYYKLSHFYLFMQNVYKFGRLFLSCYGHLNVFCTLASTSTSKVITFACLTFATRPQWEGSGAKGFAVGRRPTMVSIKHSMNMILLVHVVCDWSSKCIL